LCKEKLLSGRNQPFADIEVLWSRHSDSSMTGRLFIRQAP
jgi:hypothetical protein